MAKLSDIPSAILNKIKEYAFLKYDVADVNELKAKIVDQQFEIIVNEYLNEANMRLKRVKISESQSYEPAENEVVTYLDAMINAATPAVPVEPEVPAEG